MEHRESIVLEVESLCAKLQHETLFCYELQRHLDTEKLNANLVHDVGTGKRSAVTAGSHPSFAQICNPLVQKKSRSAPIFMYECHHFV